MTDEQISTALDLLESARSELADAIADLDDAHGECEGVRARYRAVHVRAAYAAIARALRHLNRVEGLR